MNAASDLPVRLPLGIRYQVFGFSHAVPRVLGMGAQGAWWGTLWIGAQENHTSPALLQRLIASASEDTHITSAHSGKPCRAVRSDWIDAWTELGAPAPLAMRLQKALSGDVFASMHQFEDAARVDEAAGQPVFGIERETTMTARMRAPMEDLQTAWPCNGNWGVHYQ